MKIIKANILLKDAILIARSYGFDITSEWVLEHWGESHRFWHTADHLYEILAGINELKEDQKCSYNDYKVLIIAAIFHDIVYDPKNKDNEEKSIELMLSTFNKKIVDYTISISDWNIKSDIEKIIKVILGTKTHENRDGLCKKFNKYDTMILDSQFIDMLDWEKKIFQEYKWLGWKKYKKERIKFLLGQIKSHSMNAINLKNLIDYITNKNPKIGIFCYDVDNIPSIEEFKFNLEKIKHLFDIIYVLLTYDDRYDKVYIKDYAKATDNEFFIINDKNAINFISKQPGDITLIRHLEFTDDKAKDFNQKLKEKIKNLRFIFV